MFAYLKAWLIVHMPKEEKGQDLAEYALLLALIAILVIAALVLLAPQISAVFQYIADQLADVVGP